MKLPLRIMLPIAAIVAGILSSVAGYQAPLSLPVFLQLPHTWAFLIIGVALVWQFDFIVASALCAAAMAIVIWQLSNGLDATLFIAAAICWPVPFAVIQLLFFRRPARKRLLDVFQPKREPT